MDEDEMLVKMNKLFFVGNLTDSWTPHSQKDIKVLFLGQIALSRKERCIPVGEERGDSGNATIAFYCRD